MVDWGELTLFLYITARMSGFVLFNPLLGRRNIPGIFRGGLILTLSVFVFSVTEQKVDVPGETIVFAIQILLELALGFILGMVMNFFFYIVQTTIISVGDNCLALFLKFFQIIDYFASEECCTIFQRWLVDNYRCSFCFDTLHNSLNR